MRHALRTALILAFAAPLGAACGTTSAPSPFVVDAGADGGIVDASTGIGGGSTLSGGGGAAGAGGGGGQGGAITGPDAGDPTLGGPCVDDGQCKDDLDCTSDACDLALHRCRFSPDDSACANGVTCDGVERCDNKLGCVPGAPVSCDDHDVCTIDTCTENAAGCLHVPRDVDGDGDPDDHCQGGKDCDDNDPSVSSLHAEICANGRDDNCDGKIDELPCSSPEHDTCLDPLQISAAGAYAMTTVGAKLDYTTSCGFNNLPGAGDVVAALVLPPGPPVDVIVAAHAANYAITAAIAAQCGDPASEIACSPDYGSSKGGTLAKLIARGLGDPAAQTAYPIYVGTQLPEPVILDIEILPAAAKATNETCGTAAPITPGTPVDVPIYDAAKDLASFCGSPLGDLVYTFDVAVSSDLNAYATSADGDGTPMISLRGPGCALITDELACAQQDPAHVFRHALPPGTYYLSVSASAPTTVIADVELSTPSPPPADETCKGSPVLPPNKTIDVPLAGHQSDVTLCYPGVADAAYDLTIAAPSDVLLIERISNGDIGVLSLEKPSCGGLQDALVCAAGSPSPVRATKRNVPPGDYRVVLGSQQAQATQVTAFVRPTVPPTLIPFADACADAVTIPATGGFFEGNTGNASGDFSAGCDLGGVPGGGAPDQLLQLTLAAKKRVVLDMTGSGYTTILDVRKGPGCPGVEVPLACAVGYYQGRSYLDLALDPGTYYVQIDGFNLSAGPWFLDVRVVDP